VAELRDVVFDCVHPASLARFWAEALDGYAVAPYDDTELARLRANGITDAEYDPTVLVEGSGSLPRFWFQRVAESKVVKNRMHLDLRVKRHGIERDEIDDQNGVDHAGETEAEVRRLTALGASVAPHQPNPTLIVMHDPEGNEFCLLR
jgi:Glyoxalase-like domain